MKRRDFALTLPALAALAHAPAFAQSRKDAVVMGMTLEPPVSTMPEDNTSS